MLNRLNNPILLAFLMMVALLIFAGQEHLTKPYQARGDVARDMLNATQYDQGSLLLLGHHSEGLAKHPGPFFLYVHNVIHDISSWAIPYRFGTWTLAAILLNSFFLILGVSLWMRVFGVQRASIALYAVVVAALFLLVYDYLYTLHMPFKFIAPYFAFLATLPLLSRGRLEYFPASAFLVSVLIHGYMTFVVMAFPFMAGALAIGIYRAKPLDKNQLRKLAIGLGIGAIFLLPILLDVIINSPNNIEYILDGIERGQSAKPPLQERFDVILDIATKEILPANNKSFFVAMVLLACGTLFVDANKGYRKPALLLAIAVVGVYLLFVLFHVEFYAAKGSFIGRYLRAIPLIIMSASLLLIFRTISNIKRNSKAIRQGFVVSVCLLLLYNLVFVVDVSLKKQTENVQIAAAKVDKLLPPEQTVYLGCLLKESATAAPELALQLKEMGRTVVILTEDENYKATRPAAYYRHHSEGLTPNVLVGKQVNYTSPIFVRKATLPTDANSNLFLQIGKTFAYNIWKPEGKKQARWSTGYQSYFMFQAGDIPDGSELELRFATKGKQRLQINLNGKNIADGLFGGPDNRVIIPLGEGVKNSVYKLSFFHPDATHAKSEADKRLLAIRFFSLKLLSEHAL